MEWGKIVGLTLLYGYWILLAVGIVLALFKWWKTTSPLKTFCRTFFGNLYSADEKLDGGIFFIGAFWLCVISIGIYFALQHLDYQSVFEETLKDIITVGLMVVAYVVGKHFACLYSKRWANYVCVYLGISVLSLIAWAAYGTHVEDDGDPIYGGGTRVVDFVPTETQRSNRAGHIFFTFLPAALLGVYRGQNSQERKAKELVAAIALAEQRSKQSVP